MFAVDRPGYGYSGPVTMPRADDMMRQTSPGGLDSAIVVRPKPAAIATTPEPSRTARVTIVMPEGSRLLVNDVPVEVNPAARTFETPALEPGKPYRFEVPVMPTANLFKKGSRIRLELANGDSALTDFVFEHVYLPNKIGKDTIYHSAAQPSQLLLPVITSQRAEK